MGVFNLHTTESFLYHVGPGGSAGVSNPDGTPASNGGGSGGNQNSGNDENINGTISTGGTGDPTQELPPVETGEGVLDDNGNPIEVDDNYVSDNDHDDSESIASEPVVTVDERGNITTTYPEGHDPVSITEQPDGVTHTYYLDDRTVSNYPDGRVITYEEDRYGDLTIATAYPDGRNSFELGDGSRIVTTPGGGGVAYDEHGDVAMTMAPTTDGIRLDFPDGSSVVSGPNHTAVLTDRYGQESTFQGTSSVVLTGNGDSDIVTDVNEITDSPIDYGNNDSIAVQIDGMAQSVEIDHQGNFVIVDDGGRTLTVLPSGEMMWGSPDESDAIQAVLDNIGSAEIHAYDPVDNPNADLAAFDRLSGDNHVAQFYDTTSAYLETHGFERDSYGNVVSEPSAEYLASLSVEELALYDATKALSDQRWVRNETTLDEAVELTQDVRHAAMAFDESQALEQSGHEQAHTDAVDPVTDSVGLEDQDSDALDVGFPINYADSMLDVPDFQVSVLVSPIDVSVAGDSFLRTGADFNSLGMSPIMQVAQPVQNKDLENGAAKDPAANEHTHSPLNSTASGPDFMS